MAVFSVKTVKLLIVFLLATQAVSQELNSTLHSTLYGVEVAYVDETVVFTCVVMGSNSMAWTSDEYIGTGGQRLEFSAAEPAGTRLSAVGNSQTTAVLINATIDEIIVSELRIRIQPNFQIASVQCYNINAGTNSSITFLLAADTTFVVCDKQTVCSGETVTCTCTTTNSNSLTWTNDGNRIVFTSGDPLLTRRVVDGSSTFAVLTDNSDTNGIRVITSNFTLVASSSRSDIILTCENVGLSTSESVIIPVSEFSIMTTIESCADPSGPVTTPAGSGDDPSSVGTQCVGSITAAAVVPVIVGLVAVIITAVAWGFYCIRYNNKIKELKKENAKLKSDVTDKTLRLQDTVRDLSNKERELKQNREQLHGKENELRIKQEQLQEKDKALKEAKRKITDLEGELQRK